MKCDKCGGELKVNTSIVLTSYPPMYETYCENCGFGYIYCSEYNELETKSMIAQVLKEEQLKPVVGFNKMYDDAITDEEKTIIVNLINDKIDLAEKHIKKLNKDYKYYTEVRSNWLPDEKLGSETSDYANEIRRQIKLEEDKIDKYNNIIKKVQNG